MPGHPVRQKSQTRDKHLRRITDAVSITQNNRESVRNAARPILRASLCTASAGGNFEHQAAEVRVLCHNVHE
jgi:hypothetical protein